MIPCAIHAYHRPMPQATHRHHVIPLAWTKALGLPESRLVNLCPTGHDNLHRDLRAALKSQPYHAGETTRAIINEAVDFYRAHPDSQHLLRTLAERLVNG